jgi:outer membrane protein assembly factor BamD
MTLLTRIGLLLTIAMLLGGAGGFGCAGSAQAPKSPSQAFAETKHLVADNDWLEAETLLNGMRYQLAGTPWADSVEFLLGECNFHQGKFVLAAMEYGSLRRLFPTSPLNQEAQFRIADSYYSIAPPPGIDQEYTGKAIEEYQVFIEQFGKRPGTDSLVQLASGRIRELRNKQGQKYYDAAVLYYNMNRFKACAEYCDVIQDKFYDTDYADKSSLLKIKSFVEIRRYNEAYREIEKFLGLYRSSLLVPDVRSLRESIADKVVTQR